VRALCEGLPKSVSWREGRAWVVQEGPLTYLAGEESEKGTVVMKGYVRGGRLSANRLIHLPNLGDFQLDKVRAPASSSGRLSHHPQGPDLLLPLLVPQFPPPPAQIIAAPLASAAPARAHANAMSTDPASAAVLSAFDPESADTLDALNEPDFMANEQTWPTEEEMAGGQQEHEEGSMGPPRLPNAKMGTTPRSIRKVPKGTSAYQAAWIGSDDEADDDEDDDEGSDDGSAMDDDDEDDERLAARDDVDGMDGLDGRDEDDDEQVEVESRRGGDTASVRFTDRDEVEEQARSVHSRLSPLLQPRAWHALTPSSPNPQTGRVQALARERRSRGPPVP
jgi:pre-rRNA-processing protein TSR1